MNWKILERQPELKPYTRDIELRMDNYRRKCDEILSAGQSLADFGNGYLYYGVHRYEDGWVYREWAPGARALYLIGDFNNWNRYSHPLTRTDNGNWEIYTKDLYPLCHYKVAVTGADGRTMDRLPLFCNYTYQDPKTADFCAVAYDPIEQYEWHDQNHKISDSVPPLIYEAHVGMANEEGRISSYREFADNILPRIKKDGYNTVQLMAIMEHPYYGSFGYQVSNFYAPSSRFGEPDDLKYLIDTAHQMGINVLLDLVHSHSVSNYAEGIDGFDGSGYQFFKAGAAGDHPAWGSKVFDYGKTGVLHFLLSNLKYWLDVYHFDGFRFDGVTSMLYLDHGLGANFTGPEKYFTMNIDANAVTYLQLATELIHQVKKDAILISEDMSALPGMCLPVKEGGIGFDYRLSMGLPDFFTRMIKTKEDGNWDIGMMVWELLARRNGEKVIAYAESHDQAIVGDQTYISRLAGAKIYTAMRADSNDIYAERAVSLSKLIRLAVICAGGDGYLNFMGNEFAHPEWVDFPREGNGWSYHYCRRQWSLAENKELRYVQIGEFDKKMVDLIRENRILTKEPRCLFAYEDTQALAFERNGFVFVFNFHPVMSQTRLFVPSDGSKYRCVLSSDDKEYGGQGRISTDYIYTGKNGFEVYLPARSAAVYKKI